MAISTRRSSGPVIRSLSPSGRFYSPATSSSSSSTGFASSSSAFSSRASSFFHRSTSPTRLNLYSTPNSSSPSLSFSLDSHRPISPSRSISSVPSRNHHVVSSTPRVRRTCMCSPTNHPGSFRCSFHKNLDNNNNNSSNKPYQSNRLNARRSAMTNSLVRIGTVEGDLVKRALAALIRPSSHQQKRRGAFRPAKSRLSAMSKADH